MGSRSYTTTRSTKPKKISKKSRWEETLWLFLCHEHPDDWVREYRFHPKRRWRFDFALIPQKIAVEVDGLVYGNRKGGHQTAQGFENDREKDIHAMLLGWKVVRVTPSMVKKGTAYLYIEELTHAGARK